MYVIRCAVCGSRNRVPAVGEGIPCCGKCHASLPWVADAGDGDFADIASTPAVPVVVDLWAPWCPPCRLVSPALERLAREMAGEVKLVRVNIDHSPNVVRSFVVMAVPTLLVMRRGQEIARRSGVAPPRQLRHWLAQAIAGT